MRFSTQWLVSGVREPSLHKEVSTHGAEGDPITFSTVGMIPTAGKSKGNKSHKHHGLDKEARNTGSWYGQTHEQNV